MRVSPALDVRGKKERSNPATNKKGPKTWIRMFERTLPSTIGRMCHSLSTLSALFFFFRKKRKKKGHHVCLCLNQTTNAPVSPTRVYSLFRCTPPRLYVGPLPLGWSLFPFALIIASGLCACIQKVGRSVQIAPPYTVWMSSDFGADGRGAPRVSKDSALDPADGDCNRPAQVRFTFGAHDRRRPRLGERKKRSVRRGLGARLMRTKRGKRVRATLFFSPFFFSLFVFPWPFPRLAGWIRKERRENGNINAIKRACPILTGRFLHLCAQRRRVRAPQNDLWAGGDPKRAKGRRVREGVAHAARRGPDTADAPFLPRVFALDRDGVGVDSDRDSGDDDSQSAPLCLTPFFAEDATAMGPESVYPSRPGAQDLFYEYFYDAFRESPPGHPMTESPLVHGADLLVHPVLSLACWERMPAFDDDCTGAPSAGIQNGEASRGGTIETDDDDDDILSIAREATWSKCVDPWWTQCLY